MEDKNKIFQQKIIQNQQERLEKIEKRKEMQKSNENPEENIDLYWNNINLIKNKIYNAIISLENEKNKTIKLDEIKKEITNLRSYVANSTYFLTSYDVKQSQNLIDTINSDYEVNKEKYLPRKKFSFGSKRTFIGNKSVKESNDNKVEINDLILQSKNDELKIENKNNETVIIKNGELNGKDVKLSNLTKCIIAMYFIIILKIDVIGLVQL